MLSLIGAGTLFVLFFVVANAFFGKEKTDNSIAKQGAKEVLGGVKKLSKVSYDVASSGVVGAYGAAKEKMDNKVTMSKDEYLETIKKLSAPNPKEGQKKEEEVETITITKAELRALQEALAARMED